MYRDTDEQRKMRWPPDTILSQTIVSRTCVPPHRRQAVLGVGRIWIGMARLLTMRSLS